jgi:hypothetical protein
LLQALQILIAICFYGTCKGEDHPEVTLQNFMFYFYLFVLEVVIFIITSLIGSYHDCVDAFSQSIYCHDWSQCGTEYSKSMLHLMKHMDCGFAHIKIWSLKAVNRELFVEVILDEFKI